MRPLAYASIGLILALGLCGLMAPSFFVAIVGPMQAPPALYVAALIRTTVGVILFLIAPRARAPLLFRMLGAVIAVGGAVTPFLGEAMGRRILETWSQGGSGTVRGWGLAAVALAGLLFRALHAGSPGTKPRSGS